MIEKRESTAPKPRASSGSIFPSGTALFFVLSISESMSLSYHMLIAPDAPAPTDIQSTEMKKKKGCIDKGARAMPHIEVNTARAITLGLRSDKKSLTVLLVSEMP